MAEEEWLSATEPGLMLNLLHPAGTPRKLRLFAIACCRRLSELQTSGECVAALGAAELFADGLVPDAARSEARKQAQRAAQGRGITRTPTIPKWMRRAASAVYYAAARDASEAAWNARQLVIESLIWRAGGYTLASGRDIAVAEGAAQVCLLRDIFGNPFRPVTLDPRWQSETVVALASGIYAERAFDRMLILADALEDAGCDNADILAHCRGDGPHVRGCWVVDLILGKS